MVNILTPEQAAKIVNKCERTLLRWRRTGEGPPFVRLGSKAIGYPTEQFNEWVAAHTFKHFAEESMKTHAGLQSTTESRAAV